MLKMTNLRLARLRAGKTQYDVEIETGIHQSALSLYEKGYRKPKQAHILALGQCYGVPIKGLGSNEEK